MPDTAELAVRRLEDLLSDVTSRKPVSQAIVAVESGDRSFQWIGTEGETASGRPVAEDTPFFIASIDKLYNATITLMLNEAGRLDVNESICAYLPSTVTRGLHRHHGVDYSEKITVRHLLTHTSGLGEWLDDYPKGGPSLLERVVKEGDRLLTIEEVAAYVRDCLRPHFPPQDLTQTRPKVRYSDTNFMLIIAIVEAVTGRPLHEIHQNMLYEPLGLRRTCFVGREWSTSPAREPMPLQAAGEPLEIPLLMESMRGIYATAGDMIAFLRGLMSGELFRCAETLVAMQRDWRRFGFPLDRAALSAPSWPIEYATGMMRFSKPRLFSPRAPMPPVLGHTGATGCWLFYCSELDTFLAGSVNELTAAVEPFRIVPNILSILRTLRAATHEVRV